MSAVTDHFGLAWWRGRLASLGALLAVRPPEELAIMPLDAAVAALGHRGEVDLGRQEVHLAHVVGTQARAEDFDRDFRPRSRLLRHRWEAAAACPADRPVDLVRLGDLHFVVDGHHRVSVAKSRGFPTIEARVRQILTVAFGMACLRLIHLASKNAERQFLERVPLPEDVRPGLWLDNPADWARLADAAEAWGYRQALAGRRLDRRALAEAWWTEEVQPLVRERRADTRYDIETYCEAVLPRTTRSAMV
ncbi:hypothetical protein [Amycolatopsis suaedae]|uniref:Chromosome partitioning protein ParB n=1 Tax=Amycolatopsis suaedae TaxID=2510978 RepID=A0A4Q7JB56_9PSEU|nr:hypothetical protein [Amycolatopsis suaedae]RZQ65041.1 hypothetical protein EWH70_03820 [Amycolatopsis suaedae]